VVKVTSGYNQVGGDAVKYELKKTLFEVIKEIEKNYM